MRQDGEYNALFKVGWSGFASCFKNFDFQGRKETQLEDKGWTEAVQSNIFT